MPTSFFQYEMLPMTWFYLSTLIILAVFFKFNRFWSVRNLDLLSLIIFTPGLLLTAMYDNQWGYVWLFGVGALFAVRLFFDNAMVRRPLLEPNLTPGGLTFSCFFLFLFIAAAVTVNRGERIDTVRTVRLEQILTTRHLAQGRGIVPGTWEQPRSKTANLPPGFLPFLVFAEHSNFVFIPPTAIRREILQLPKKDSVETAVSVESLDAESTLLPDVPPPSLGLLAATVSSVLLGHLLLILGFVYIGHCHFGNIRTGIACATLYMLVPYSSQMVGRLDHLFPAVLILWAAAMYRRPFFAGLWIGIAAALVWYPLFLVPLWCSFYWRRGWVRFLSGIVTAFVLFLFLLLFSPSGLGSYAEQLVHLMGKSSFYFFSDADGFWAHYDNIHRIPLLAVFFVVCFGMILWPSHKHLATLLSCSALLMLGVQFWQIHQGALAMAWYLPLLVLTIFRPNLEDKTASTVAAV